MNTAYTCINPTYPGVWIIDFLYRSEAALSCDPTVSSLYNDEIDFRISFYETDDDDCT
ncbi:hypothetical protein Tco_0577162, partial [Tanacetum coccineum]